KFCNLWPKRGSGVYSYLPAALCETYLRAVVDELLRHVCLVGTVYLDSALPLFARGTGWARLWSYGNDHLAGGAESGWNVSRVRQLWLGGGLSGTSEVV